MGWFKKQCLRRMVPHHNRYVYLVLAASAAACPARVVTKVLTPVISDSSE